jgi:phosphoglycolate phosphatase-like HAD superfamily hydrolase
MMNLAIFDIDGTLTNTNSVDDRCFVDAMAEAHAITDISTDWASYPHTTDSGIMDHVFQEKLGRGPEESELGKFKSCFVSLLSAQYNSQASNFDEIAGASRALDRLKRTPDWAIAIATGSWRESALLKLKAARIDVDDVPAAYAEDGLSREEILESAVSQSIEQYGVSSFEKIVSIGDGLWDLRTAHRLGFSFLGIGSGPSAVTLQRAGAKHVAEDFTDYEQLLRLLNEAEIPAAGG